MDKNIVKESLTGLVKEHADSEGWVNLAVLGLKLSDAGINYKELGHDKLTNFIEAHTDILEIRADKTHKPPVHFVKLRTESAKTNLNVLPKNALTKMENKEVKIWKGIEFNDNWSNTDTSKFDDLASSWYKKRKEFEDGESGYYEFLDMLKRQHAIETGIVEKLYDLSERITQTLIKEGFVESYISHNDANIPPKKLMQYLHDHFEAMDFVFDWVKAERPLTVGFIKELHHLVTQHQDDTEVINTLGEIVQAKLLKGQFKTHENNPKRDDGQIFIYCPPVHVESEMDKLIEIYEEQSAKELNPVVLSAWAHHAFAQIRPFQDSNGRMARLLASLILIKNGLLPFTVKREDKPAYIQSLELADTNEPQELVSFFSVEQKKSIENALNFKTERTSSSLKDLANIFNEKVDKAASQQRQQREKELTTNRNKVFDFIYAILGDIKAELEQLIPDKARTGISSVKPDQDKYYWHTHQITEYASAHKYFFNRQLPRGWFGIHFNLPTESSYNLIITVHHYGHEDSVVAVGAFMEFSEKIKDKEEEDKKLIPTNISPFTISLEKLGEKTKDNLNAYIHDILKAGLKIMINEIN